MESSSNQKKSVFEYIVESNRSILFNALDSFDGEKVIVWDSSLIKKFDLVSN